MGSPLFFRLRLPFVNGIYHAGVEIFITWNKIERMHHEKARRL